MNIHFSALSYRLLLACAAREENSSSFARTLSRKGKDRERCDSSSLSPGGAARKASSPSRSTFKARDNRRGTLGRSPGSMPLYHAPTRVLHPVYYTCIHIYKYISSKHNLSPLLFRDRLPFLNPSSVSLLYLNCCCNRRHLGPRMCFSCCFFFFSSFSFLPIIFCSILLMIKKKNENIFFKFCKRFESLSRQLKNCQILTTRRS